MSGRAFLPPRTFNDHPSRNDADRTLVWPDGSIYRITRSSADMAESCRRWSGSSRRTARPLNRTYVLA
jgi:hypothetical protein